jgi:hypothetical protein
LLLVWLAFIIGILVCDREEVINQDN